MTLTDRALFDLTRLTGARQAIDIYLAGLAFRKNGRMATLERSLVWQAVGGAEAGLIERIPMRSNLIHETGRVMCGGPV